MYILYIYMCIYILKTPENTLWAFYKHRRDISHSSRNKCLSKSLVRCDLVVLLLFILLLSLWALLGTNHYCIYIYSPTIRQLYAC